MNVEAFRDKIEAFRNRLEGYRHTHVCHTYVFSDLSYGGLEWSEWYKLSTMTRNIDYGCHFGWKSRNDSVDDPPKCTKQRADGETDEQCCCFSCGSNLGYLKFIQNDPKVIKRIARLFQPKIGFWRKNRGCVLPRKYRSAVCLGYRCDPAKKYDIYGAKGMLVLFMDSIRVRQLSDKDIRILGRALLKTIS